jgi:hypothetical protein
MNPGTSFQPLGTDTFTFWDGFDGGGADRGLAYPRSGPNSAGSVHTGIAALH